MQPPHASSFLSPSPSPPLFSPALIAQDSVTIDNGDGPQAVTPSALVAAWKLNAEGVDTMYHQISAPIVSFQVRARNIKEGPEVVVWCGVVGVVVL